MQLSRFPEERKVRGWRNNDKTVYSKLRSDGDFFPVGRKRNCSVSTVCLFIHSVG